MRDRIKRILDLASDALFTLLERAPVTGMPPPQFLPMRPVGRLDPLNSRFDCGIRMLVELGFALLGRVAERNSISS